MQSTQASTQWLPTLRTTLGLREEEFSFDVNDKVLSTETVRANIFSPKLGIVLGPWGRTSYFISAAEGYHSNDAHRMEQHLSYQ